MRLFIVSLLLFALTGCATITALSSNPVVQAGVKYGIIRLLSDNPGKQPQALAVIKEVRKYAGQAPDTTIDDLAQRTMEIIPWDRMNLADQMLAQDMVLYASNYLKKMVGDGVLDADARVEVDLFLRWIEQAVRLVKQ